MSMYRKEWDCCGSVTETEAWEPDACPFCTPAGPVPASTVVRQVCEEYRGTRWGKAAEAIGDRIIARMGAPVPASTGRERIYQVQFVGEYASSIWHDATEDAYNTFMPERRRIVYAAPVAARGAAQSTVPVNTEQEKSD